MDVLVVFLSNQIQFVIDNGLMSSLKCNTI